MTADAVVIGAGIVGAACADALSTVGLRVAVVESRVIGGGATAAGMGHIVVMDDSEAQFALTHYSQQLWRTLSPEMPAELEWDPSGTLWVAADEEEMQAVAHKHAYYVARGVNVEVLDAAQLADAEPNLRRGLHGALLIPGDSVVYAPCAAAWLLARAQLRRASLLADRVISIGRHSVHLTTGDRIESPNIILASGAWARELLPAIPVRPRKGHLAITARYPGFLRRQLVELGYLKSAHGHDTESVAFNLQPRTTGQLLIGSSRQYDVTHTSIDAPFLARMLRRAIHFMPALEHLRVIRAWTGFRAATPDSLPLIGPAPGREGLWLATGHEGLGITTSLATGRLIADAIAGRTPAIPPEPYLPARFPQ
ncbi:MAG: FAD-binding oxidoreductase [Acidimicrobiia bacterium]|nr:FAD-binding oxidoreductase [Acidimicrobiia bacterium]